MRDKDLTAQLYGYDGVDKMVEFHLAVWVPGGPDDGHYEIDPKSSAAYRLALSPTARITAISSDCTGPSAGNPNVDARSAQRRSSSAPCVTSPE